MAGVSPAAVSIAINGRDGISDETRTRILAIARQQHYIPGANAQRILQKRSRYIAILFRTDALLGNQIFYSEIAINAMAACQAYSYTLIPTFVTGEPGAIVLPQPIVNGDVDGVLVCGDQEPGIYTELRQLGIPYVILDSSRHEDPHPAVFVDYAEAAYQAARHLLELGHRDIAYLSNGALHDFNSLTLSGFQRATGEAGISLYPNRFQIDLHDERSVARCVDQALAGPVRPTAILCTVDIYAINIMRYLHTCGLRVPEDISVIGIDDVQMSKFVIPSLTTMHVDRKQMLAIALEMLTTMIDGGACENRMLPVPELICRESTSAPVGI